MASSLLFGLYYFRTINGAFDGVKGVYRGLFCGVFFTACYWLAVCCFQPPAIPTTARVYFKFGGTVGF